MSTLRTCAVCRKSLEGLRSDARVCSPKCRQALRRARILEPKPVPAVTRAIEAVTRRRGEPPVLADEPRDPVAESQWDERIWHSIDEPPW